MAVRNSDSVLRFGKRRLTDAQPSANGALVMRREGATLAFHHGRELQGLDDACRIGPATVGGVGRIAVGCRTEISAWCRRFLDVTGEATMFAAGSAP